MKISSLLLFASILVLICTQCNSKDDEQPPIVTPPVVTNPEVNLPDIDLSHWKVTLPVGNPTEVTPPEILDYATNPLLQKYMFNDSINGALVFYTTPGASTANSSYSRTELREQMVPGSNSTNWTFEQGGRMKGSLALESISTNDNGDPDRVIIMQIHGRLTDAQKNLINEDDNNAPPVLKIYWNNNRVRVLRKVLKNLDVSDVDILRTSSWTDEGFWFNEYVNHETFELEVIAEKDKLTVTLNDNESMVFDDVHMQKWSVFENYFKAGNYLVSTDKDAHATVKYYSLEVEH